MPGKKQLFLAIASGLALMSITSSLLPAPHASAAALAGTTEDAVRNATFTWKNESTIDVTIGTDVVTFIDPSGVQDYSDRSSSYRFNNSQTCGGDNGSWINANAKHPDQIESITISYNLGSSNGACKQYKGRANNPTASQTDRANVLYNINGNTIQRIDGANWYTFNRNAANPNLFIMPKQGNQTSCFDVIVTTAGSDTATLYELDTKSHGKGTAPAGIGADGCYISNLTDDVNGPALKHAGDQPGSQCQTGPARGVICSEFSPSGNGGFTIHLSAAVPTSTAPGTGGNANCGTANTDANGNCENADDTLNCNSGNFNWIICPVITLGAKAANSLDGFIMNTLDIDVKEVFGRSSEASNGYYTAWNSFRILAVAIIVIAGLIMVTSQALGLEMLDAYTIRKVLPRLFVAIVGISLSWPLMSLAVSFFDTLGIDIRELIYAPFSGLHSTISAGAGFLTTGVTLAVLFAMGLPALTFIITAVLGVAVGYVILVLRQIVLIMLIIIAPVAIACYVLPGTQRAWKLWHENFIGLLLMFPIISALIAVGHVFSAVALKNGGNNTGSLAATALAIFAYFLPYFALPAAARFSTGVIGSLAGMVNDRGKGAFDRLKAARSNAVSYRHERRKTGASKVLGNNALSGVYRRASALSTPDSGALGLTGRQRARYRSLEQAHMAKNVAAALEQDGNRSTGDDHATALAVEEGMTRRRFVQEYQRRTNSTTQQAEQALTDLERGLGMNMGTEGMRVAAFRARNASSTAYDNNAQEITLPDGTRRMETQAEAANRATAQRFNEGAALINDGLITSADATAFSRGNRARLDISGRGFGSTMNAYNTVAENLRAGGAGMTADNVNANLSAQNFLDQTLNEADPGDMLAGNTRTIQAMAPAMRRNLDTQVRAATQADGTLNIAHEGLNRALGQIAGIQDNLNRTSPQKAAMFADSVNSLPVTIGTDGRRMTVRQMVNEAASRPPTTVIDPVTGIPTAGVQTFLDVRKEYSNARVADAAGATAPPAEPET
ncbi:MAG TPA: hypothetical protein VLF59_06135 [Candidatus Saccharimonadales bacterium]|nr:hypothetical protein [Candidatus Saccharimonadales bacterium]